MVNFFVEPIKYREAIPKNWKWKGKISYIFYPRHSSRCGGSIAIVK